MEKTKDRTLVLGVGGVLMGDDGAGVAAVELLKKSVCLPRGVECVDGGVAGLNLLPLIESCGRLIIADAVRFGKRPGAVKKIRWKQGHLLPKAAASAHGIGISEVLALAALGRRCPETVVIIGIEPEDIRPGLTLSPAVRDALPAAVAAIMKEIAAGGKRHARTPRGSKDNRCRKKRNVKGKGKKA